MAVLYLIRHGEPQITGVFLGRLDPPLSEAGREQVSKTLAAIEVKVAYVSTLLRARQTAAYLRNVRVVELDDLREMDYGEWTGKTWAEIEERWPELAAHKSADWFGMPAPGGETWQDVLQRVKPLWETIRKGEEPAAVVAHLGVNAALANVIDGRDPLAFVQQYGEVICVEY